MRELNPNLPAMLRRNKIRFKSAPEKYKMRSNNMFAKVSQYWKAIAAAVGSVLLIWNQFAAGFGAIAPASWQHPIALIVGVLTVVSTWAVPNKKPTPGQ